MVLLGDLRALVGPGNLGPVPTLSSKGEAPPLLFSEIGEASPLFRPEEKGAELTLSELEGRPPSLLLSEVGAALPLPELKGEVPPLLLSEIGPVPVLMLSWEPRAGASPKFKRGGVPPFEP